ncbi:MAG TPA: 1-deoxy-D-xylulose-5-phosphate synthase [Solirubrobacterales bacterium]|jgi:1-deoxy-D-xylulose-5-phosphate synthase|nr:1-deoxy-D-xylulose-5-phosphate synthase [Solirubrobacterales bacterium]
MSDKQDTEQAPDAGRLLEGISGPDDLNELSDDELQRLAQEVRELIIDTIGEIGGHFGANLGTCELTVALHSMLDSPRDKILWDVGHQAYPHKVLTGRREQLGTIRQYQGLAPFCSVFESEHDIMGAGHASTSIGYAVGLKEAMRAGIGEDGRVVAVIGDGALTGGVAYEALHQAGGLQTPIVIVLNDNGMSISPNVGAMSRYFQRVRLNPRWYEARSKTEERLTQLPLGLGRRMERLGPEIKSAVKAYWAPGLFFEELDLAYMGVIDGHDVGAIRRALTDAFEANRPVVVHIHTVKGKGFEPAEEGGLEGMEKWHAAKPGSIVDGKPATSGAASSASRPGAAKPVVPVSESDSPEEIEKLEKPPPPSPPQYTAVFADALVEEAKRDPRVIGITAAMAGGTGLNKLQKAVPEQYYDVGIAEQDAVLFASGLAIQGAKPVCAIYSTFLQRAFDQIVHDVCLQKLNVVFAMDRAGLVGDDGPTHQGAFDISYFRPLPNVVVMAPRDEAMLVHMLRTALAHDGGPIAFRYPRGAAEGAPMPDAPKEIEIGKGEYLLPGERVALLGYGYGVQVALRAAEILRGKGVEPTVADGRFAKPLDGDLVERLAADHELLVTIEENVLPGGFGSGVLEHLEDVFADREESRARVMRVGLPDRYVGHGKPALLREEVGFTGEAVAERVLSAIGTRHTIAG